MSNSTDYALLQLRPYIVALMESEGRDFHTCEQCFQQIPEGLWEIHHTRYKDATYYDLEIVCRSCNRIGANVGLA